MPVREHGARPTPSRPRLGLNRPDSTVYDTAHNLIAIPTSLPKFRRFLVNQIRDGSVQAARELISMGNGVTVARLTLDQVV